VNYGAAGIAYGLYRLACVREDPPLLALADLWSTRATADLDNEDAFRNDILGIRRETVGDIALYHTASGVHCLRALIAQSMGDIVSCQDAINAFLTVAKVRCDNPDLTLGRAGVLLGCALLLEATAEFQTIDGAPLAAFGNALMQSLWEPSGNAGAMGLYGKPAFGGIAHGWAGLAYATMRWCLRTGAAVPQSLATCLERLQACAEPFGSGARWPRKLVLHTMPRAGDYVAGWCNGSAGFVHLWTLAHTMFREHEYLKLAQLAAWHALETPEPFIDLCCGLAGKAYALLNLYKHTGDSQWLMQARSVGEEAARRSDRLEAPPWSLYKGELGVALLVAELERPEASCMPLFESEGWPMNV